MTLSGEKYLTVAVIIIVYIEEVGALIASNIVQVCVVELSKKRLV